MSDLGELAKKENVEALLLTKSGVLLHNLGKVSSQFLKKQLKIDCPNFLYQHILGLIDAHCPNIPTRLWDKCPNLSNSDILDPVTKQALSGNPFRLPFPFDDREYVPGDLIEYLGQKEPWYNIEPNQKLGILYLFQNGSRLTHLMNRAHRGASGGEKEYIYTEQQSSGHNLYHATPFGWESPAPGISDVDDVRLLVEKVIQQHVNNRQLTSHPLEFSQDLFPHLSRVIADTQRPFNDVTVWDIGHTGMAFLITQAVSRILMHRPLEHAELAKIESSNTLFWRILSIRTDGLRYLADVSTLADLRVRKSQLDKALRGIQLSLEKDSLAFQVYRDENGSHFIFPELEDLSESILRNVKLELLPLIEIEGHILDVKLSPAPLVSHPKDEGGLYVGEFIRKELGKNLTDKMDPMHIAQTWTEPYLHAEICSACGVRPQGYGAETVTCYRANPNYYSNKAKLRHLCCLCMHHRSGVAERWISRIRRGIDKGTVWTDEVADDKGRIALIAGQFPMESFMRSMFYPHKETSSAKKEYHHQVEWIGNPPAPESTIEIERQGKFMWTGTALVNSNELAAFQASDLKIHPPVNIDVTLIKVESDKDNNIFIEVSEDLSTKSETNTVKIMGADFVVVDNHRLRATDKAKDKVKNSLLWHDDSSNFFFWVSNVREITIFQTRGKAAENDSFARLRRIWETTRRFWQETCPTDEKENLAQSIVGKKVGHTGPRLEITGMIQPRLTGSTLGEYHAYDLVLSKGVKMSVVWDPVNNRFITCDNLNYLNGEGLLGQSSQEVLRLGAIFSIQEPIDYGSKSKIWGTITLNADASIVQNSNYTPSIPILAEPRTFMALVPADKALEVVKEIKSKYEREMGKVRNRLPLHLGIVYSHRHAPLRAILNAGWRMLDQSANPESWKVVRASRRSIEKGDQLPKRFQDNESGQFREWFEILLEKDNRGITWCVPAVMGDGTTPDLWYPYVFLYASSEPSDRNRRFQAPNPWTGSDGWLVHVADLRTDDIVYFTPATLDFQCLDSAGRRFEIAYDSAEGASGQRRGLPRRPYLLDELEELQTIWEMLKDHLSKTQIHILRDLIEAKREEWQVISPTLAEFDQQGKPIRPDNVFWQFCYDSLANAEWNEGKMPWDVEPCDSDIWLAQWANHAARGWITDVVELYLQIMKEDI